MTRHPRALAPGGWRRAVGAVLVAFGWVVLAITAGTAIVLGLVLLHFRGIE